MSIFSRKTEVQVPLQDHTVYLIDTENVRTVWTLLLDKMSDNDKIYVFYTMNSGNVSYEDLNGIISSGRNVELIQCHTGKNGLDFQLVSYLGYLIRNNENADYCIISDDSGYDAVVKFWEGRDIDVTRKTAFQISGKQPKAPKKSIFGKKPRVPAVPSRVSGQRNSGYQDDRSRSTRPQEPKAQNFKAQETNSQNPKAQEPKAKETKSQNPKAQEPGTQNTKPQESRVQSTRPQEPKTQIPRSRESKSQSEIPQKSMTPDVRSQELKSVAAKSQDVKPAAVITQDNNSQDFAQPADFSQVQSPSEANARVQSPAEANARVQSPAEAKAQVQDREKSSHVKTDREVMAARIRQLLPEEPDDKVSLICDIVRKYGGRSGLADIHDEIEKLYRNEKASDIYRIIRHSISDICN